MELVEEQGTCISRACRVMCIERSYYHYKNRKDDTEVEEAIRAAAVHNDGFGKIYQVLRNQGHKWNRKRVYRIYRKMCYSKRVKLKKRVCREEPSSLPRPDRPNVTWSMDFVSDRLECGRKFRVFNVIDDCDRNAIAQDVYLSMPAERVVKLLEKAVWIHGKPDSIRCDNGPEFISGTFRDWCRGNGIELCYIKPGCPTQNALIERFNGSYRRAVLDAYIFRTLGEVREQTEKWMKYYNEERPHEGIGNMTPNAYREMLLSAVSD